MLSVSLVENALDPLLSECSRLCVRERFHETTTLFTRNKPSSDIDPLNPRHCLEIMHFFGDYAKVTLETRRLRVSPRREREKGKRAFSFTELSGVAR